MLLGRNTYYIRDELATLPHIAAKNAHIYAKAHMSLPASRYYYYYATNQTSTVVIYTMEALKPRKSHQIYIGISPDTIIVWQLFNLKKKKRNIKGTALRSALVSDQERAFLITMNQWMHFYVHKTYWYTNVLLCMNLSLNLNLFIM